MNGIRRGILRAADQLTLVGLHAGKMFGFLGSGLDSVVHDEGESGPVVRFPDLSSEGWPEFVVALPVHAQFRYASAGPLSRMALWHVPERRDRVIGELEGRPDGLRFEVKADGSREATLGEGTTVRAHEEKPDGTLLAVKQVREPGAIADVLRSRAAARKANS